MQKMREKDGESIMKVYFDTEFTGLHKDTTLISIGLVAENEKEFYAELTDYAKEQCSEWIADNVIRHLLIRPTVTEKGIEEDEKCGWTFDDIPPTYKENSPLIFQKTKVENDKWLVNGDKEYVGKKLEEWFAQFDNVQLVSDVCHYDMVLLIDLFGGAFDLPKNVSAVCHDINQDIAKHYGISERKAFDKSREEIVKELCGEEIRGDKHNALYDAKVIKAIYKEIN